MTMMGSLSVQNIEYRDTPHGWSPEEAETEAKELGLELSPEHWEMLYALQAFYASHEDKIIRFRELHDALDEKFHLKGGIRYLYTLFPGGPVAQGCKIAGLKAPAGAVDLGFGSVV